MSETAVLRETPRIHLTTRALARWLQVASRGSPAAKGWRRAAVAGCTIVDLVVWRLMRTGKIGLAARMAVDIGDVALWAAASEAGLEWSLASQVAVEVETGYVWGPVGFALPAVEAAVSSAARVSTARRLEPGTHAVHAGAVLAGILARRAEDRRRRSAEIDHSAALSAKRVRAFLAGQNDVSMGASSAIDLLGPIGIMVGVTEADSAFRQIRSGWKSTLAEQSRRHAVYLDNAVRMWETEHNQHPDLSSDVEVRVAEGAGTTVLTGSQSQRLRLLLEGRNSHGVIMIRLAEAGRTGGGRPGRPVELVVNGRSLTVPADPGVTRIRDFDPGPAVFMLAAALALNPVRRAAGQLPWRWALVPVTANLIAARLFGGDKKDAHTRQLAASLVIGAAQGAICAGRCSVRRTGTGAHLFHGTYGIAPTVMLLSTKWSRASPRARWATVVAMSLISLGAYRLSERPRSVRDLSCALAWPIGALIGSAGLTSAVSVENRQIEAELASADDVEERLEWQRGRASVMDLVDAAVREAESALTANTLDPRIRREATSRLADVREFLREAQLASECMGGIG